MRKLFFTITMMFVSALLSAQITYYVDENGNNDNDGLSASTPLQTLKKAEGLINANNTSAEYVIMITGTVTDASAQSAFKFNSDYDVTLTIKGESAATSIVQKADDETWLSKVEAKQNIGRFFNMPQNAGTGSLTVIFEDLTFQNFGHNAANGGQFMNALLDCDIIIRRCNFRNGVARAGVLFQTNANQRVVNLTMEDCYVDNMLAFNNGGILQSPIIVRGYSTGVFKNCVFTNCGLDPRSRDGNENGQYTQFGSVLTFDPAIGVLEDIDLPHLVTGEVTNCTFLNNGYIPTISKDSAYTAVIAEVEDTLSLSVVSVLVDSAEAVNLSFNNNLIIGNHRDASNTVDVKAIVDPNGTLTSTSFTHNIMNSVAYFDASTCDTSAAYTYFSPEIMVDATDDTTLIVSTTSTGVYYVKASGTNVKAGADGSTTTPTDITGATRVNPSVGAYEVIESTGLNELNALSFELYPNPASGLVRLSGIEGIVDVEVYNQFGQRILSTSSSELDISSVNSGLYFVSVRNSEGQRGMQTLIIR